MNSADFLSKENMKKILFLCFAIILMIVGVFKIGSILNLLSEVLNLFLPFILGACIAFIFNVPMRKIEQGLFENKPNFKGKRAISYLISLIIILGILIVALIVIIPQIITTVVQLTNQIPAFVTQAFDFVNELTEHHPSLAKLTEKMDLNADGLTQQFVGILSGASGFLSSTVGFVSSVISGFATFFIAFAFSIYVLFKKEDLARQIKKVLFAFFSKETVDKILKVGSLSDKVFSNFITGQCLEACILGSMFFIVMSIIGMPYTVLISVLIALTALVPIFGAFIGCGIGALLILIESPKQAIIFVVMFLILQQIEGNLIYPHVVGDSVGLPSIWVLVAITVGGNLMGVAGMLIFIPLCSICYSLFRDFVNNRLDKRNIDKEKNGLISDEVLQQRAEKQKDGTLKEKVEVETEKEVETKEVKPKKDAKTSKKVETK